MRSVAISSFLAAICAASAFAAPPLYEQSKNRSPGTSPTSSYKEATDISGKERCEGERVSGLSEPSADRNYRTRMEGGTKGADDPCRDMGQQAGHADESEIERGSSPGSNSYTGD